MHNHAAGNKPAIQDEEQQRVIRATGGEFLTLAPPGCGKTHVLAERIRYAHAAGVNYGDMLCLTFTNRAARGMMERIRTAISDHDIDEVYVGNIHRFCSRFLLENSLVPAETGIIDDEDVLSIMSQFIGLDEDVVAANRETRQRCYAAVHLAGFMRQIEHIHPKELRIHPECLTRGDIEALELICKVQRMTFTPAVMALIYHGADDFADIVKGDAYPAGCQQLLAAMLGKMSLARQYDEYKRDNRLIDFEDLLLLTYDALKEERDVVRGGGQGTYRHYTWCQVDEVQDLNPLQLAIIDLLMSADGADGHDPADRTMMYLGDEQQAIFSFMGAKVNTLERLKERCDGHIFRLTTNHRSPEYLLDVFNTYASEVLHIDPALLPETDWQPVRTGNELCYYRVPTLREEFTDAAQQARRLSEEDSGATTAVIVLTNNDADTISGRMDEMNIRHFKVSGTDLFSSPAVKLLIAHLAIFANEHNFIAWSRLLKGLHVYERNTSARDFVRQLTEHALTPADLMLRPGSSYVKAFARVFNEEEIVVFDTETTGLNVLEDDIVQIAAVRIRRGQIVDDSAFCVYIETEREIPKMLGDVVNPIIEERKNQHPLQHDEALRRFADYVDADILLGHNADFDYNILDANLRRYLPDYDLRAHAPIYFDTLKLTRLLVPHLRQYKLKYLLKVFKLEGKNSHLADDDVFATCSLAAHCYALAQKVIPSQETFLRLPSVCRRALLVRRNILPLYRATASRLRQTQGTGDALISTEMRNMYAYLLESNLIQPVKNIEYVFKYISQEMVDPKNDYDLITQISNHILEISTLKESDLCTSKIIEERIIITTIHKAKGLEFDNVIIFDANSDRYPNFFSLGNPAAVEEDKRKLYVAMTRAKQRLVIYTGCTKFNARGDLINRVITPFLLPVKKFFVPTHVE